MRESNPYHKYNGNVEKRLEGGLYDTPIPFTFDYYGEHNKSSIASLFKGFQFKESTAYIITMDKSFEGTEKDRVSIEDDNSLIVSINTKEVMYKGGHRDKQRKKVYLIELS